MTAGPEDTAVALAVVAVLARRPAGRFFYHRLVAHSAAADRDSAVLSIAGVPLWRIPLLPYL